MTAAEREAAREWVRHYGPHLRAVSLEARNAVATAEFLLVLLDETPESAERAAELQNTLTVLRAELERRPVLPPLHPALAEGWFLPLPQLAALGVNVQRRGGGAGIVSVRRWRSSVFDLPSRGWR